MNTFMQILLVILCLFLIWGIYKQIKANPDLLSQQNVAKSFGTMGVLALILIGGVAVLVYLVKH